MSECNKSEFSEIKYKVILNVRHRQMITKDQKYLHIKFDYYFS